jgi:hypothetical protein
MKDSVPSEVDPSPCSATATDMSPTRHLQLVSKVPFGPRPDANGAAYRRLAGALQGPQETHAGPSRRVSPQGSAGKKIVL